MTFTDVQQGDFGPDFGRDFGANQTLVPLGGYPTAGSLAMYALKKAGIWRLGTNINGGDFQDALIDLNDMLQSWNEERWMTWHLIDLAFVANGQAQFTVGPNGNFNVYPRPAKIEYAYVRQLQNVGINTIDTPLAVMETREDFSRLALKNLVAFPKSIFYDPAFPVGTVQCYPIPNASIYEIHIVVRDVWPIVLGAQTSFAFYPPAAMPAIKFNLARILRQAYGKRTPDQELNLLASGYLSTLKNSQVQVPELVMPKLLVRPGLYNIFSDQTYS